MLLIALGAAVLAQAGAAAPAETTYTFSAEQGFSLSAAPDARTCGSLDGGRLAEGLRPRFKGDDKATAMPANHKKAAAPQAHSFGSCPIQVAGSITLGAGGMVTIRPTRIEYADKVDRWFIEFGEDKIVVRNLVADRWSGSREEFQSRLAELEKPLLKDWDRLGAMPETVKEPRYGILTSAAGQALWLQAQTEAQLAALVLARLDGRRFTLGQALPVGGLPDRAVAVAARLVERIVAQCSGAIAPKGAGERKRVENARWDGTELAIPQPSWADAKYWSEIDQGRERRLRESRDRLRRMAESSNEAPITRDDWKAAVDEELKRWSQDEARILKDVRTVSRRLMVPEVVDGGKGTYDYREELKIEGQAVRALKVDASGRMRQQAIVFYDAAIGDLNVMTVTWDAWYRAEISR